MAVAVDEAITRGAISHTPAAEVGGGIVTATVRNPSDMVVGFTFNRTSAWCDEDWGRP